VRNYEINLLYDDQDGFCKFIKRLIAFFSSSYINFKPLSELEGSYAGLKAADLKYDFRLIYDFEITEDEFEAMDTSYIHGVSDKRIYSGGEAFVKALALNSFLGTLANWYYKDDNLKKYIDDYIYENTLAKKR
jgi:mRNA-degrading endonuclease YafQ of YafQ-DinJ toxin-antitoxin module